MSSLIARLIAYFFVGVLCIVGPLLLLIAAITSVPKIEFVCNSTAAEGKIISLERVYSIQRSKDVYKPVVRFYDGDGKIHIFVADSRAGFHLLQDGDRVPVLYLKDHPEIARIDTISQLWMPQPLMAFLGTLLLVFPVRILKQRSQLRSRSVYNS